MTLLQRLHACIAGYGCINTSFDYHSAVRCETPKASVPYHAGNLSTMCDVH